MDAEKPFGSIGENAGRSHQATKKSYHFLQISETQKRLFLAGWEANGNAQQQLQHDIERSK